jgi:hypothetical protein
VFVLRTIATSSFEQRNPSGRNKFQVPGKQNPSQTQQNPNPAQRIPNAGYFGAPLLINRLSSISASAILFSAILAGARTF